MTAVVEAPGKINLTLEILGRRPDGFHELRSIVLPVSLKETIEVSEREDETVTCTTVGEGIDASELTLLPPEKHLAVKAVRAMQQLCGTTRGCDVSITKRVPIGAGMGGGSADAAGVLAALRLLWGSGLDRAAMLEVAARIGSDVPALLHGGAVLMEGRGERVTPVLDPLAPAPAPFWLVVAFPGIPVSTKSVYAHCVPCLTPRSEICDNAISSVRNGDVRAASRWVHNGLQDTVYKLHPETERFCLALRNGGALSTLLSGSGSAVFGLAENREHALGIQRSLRGDMWSRVVSTMPDGVMAAHGPLVP